MPKCEHRIVWEPWLANSTRPNTRPTCDAPATKEKDNPWVEGKLIYYCDLHASSNDYKIDSGYIGAWHNKTRQIK